MTFPHFHSLLQPELDRLSGKLALLVARRPLALEFEQSLEHKLAIELTHGSTAIEGNTLTLRETQLLLDEGITPQTSKQLREIHETVNHHKALRHLQQLVEKGYEPDEQQLCHLHRLIMANIDDDRSGQYRDHRVFVTGAPRQPIRPDLIAESMKTLMTWLDQSKLHPLINAAEAHYRFVKIHPFYDGNGRTARLLFNWVLLRQGYPLTVIPATARSRYITGIDQADQDQPLDYFRLMVECVEDSLDQYLA
jgi:Fic family protein